MEKKWTPGPWTVEYRFGCTYIMAEQEALMCNETYYPWVPENQADWPLIAAAPEMAEIAIEHERRLRQCAQNIRDECPLWAADLIKMADQARAVLAKAKGETQ